MILCEMPEEKHKSMKAYYNSKSVDQNQSISNDLDVLERTGGVAIQQNRQSSTSRGKTPTAMKDN
jgi:hypothetical protein